MPDTEPSWSRNFRIPASEYIPSQKRAAKDGETVTDVVRRAIRAHGAGEEDPQARSLDQIRQALLAAGWRPPS